MTWSSESERERENDLPAVAPQIRRKISVRDRERVEEPCQGEETNLNGWSASISFYQRGVIEVNK